MSKSYLKGLLYKNYVFKYSFNYFYYFHVEIMICNIVLIFFSLEVKKYIYLYI